MIKCTCCVSACCRPYLVWLVLDSFRIRVTTAMGESFSDVRVMDCCSSPSFVIDRFRIRTCSCLVLEYKDDNKTILNMGICL